ncbi:MAG: hypothetical protein KDB82_06640, partial [Planctomycetes bacterium]|nr:hypothetical protein [Planctomycetota bacterium]
GDFALNVYLEGYWAVDLPVTIEEGKTTDLGEIRLDGFLDLDVIAISDTGGGIETYNVVATMIEGVKPPNYRQEFSVYGNLTAERTTLQRLRKGKWKVTVTAKGYATAEAEIELPTNEPLTIKLVEGGSIGVSVKIGDRGNYDNFSLFLVRCDSEYYKTLAALDDEGWRNLRIDANQPGVTGNQRSWGSPRLLEAMMPGKYLVIAFAGNFGVLREDNVEITRGKHTAVELRPEPPVVSVKVTKDGQPQAGIKLFFVTTSYNGGTVAEETSDDQGACRHEFNDAAMAYVLTQREMDWVGQPSQNNWEWGESLRRFKGDGIQLKFGTHTDVAVELNDPKGIWVTITLKAPDGVPLTAPQLTTKGSTGGWPRFESKQVGESWVFPRIPAGEYTVTTYAGGDRNQAVALTRDIKVDNPPEQSFEIEFEIQTFTVTVECPEGVDFSQVGIRLQKREDVGVFGMRTMTRDGRPDAQGKLAFVGLENDRYIIIGSAWDQNRQLVASGNVEVDSSEVSEATLKLSGDFGSLNLRVEGNPATGGRQDSATWQARFFDNMDEEVLPGDPAFAFGQVNYTRAVMGVPSGVYKVIVCAYGLQPATAYNVEIKRGVTTELTVTPSAAAVLKLTVEGIDARSLVQLGAKSNYLDANGQPVDILAPGKQLFNLMQSNQQNACEAWLLNLTPEVAKVVISIDGYEDIVINVVAEPGKTILHTAPVVKKAD